MNKISSKMPQYVPSPKELGESFQDWIQRSDTETIIKDCAKGFAYGSAAALYTAAWIFAPVPTAIAHVLAACVSASTTDGTQTPQPSPIPQPDGGPVISNRPPVWRAKPLFPDVELAEGRQLDVLLLEYATDPENDPLTFNIGNLPRGATFREDVGLFHWQPLYDQQGHYFIEVYVRDPFLQEAEASAFNIDVINVNRPPRIEIVGAPIEPIREGELLAMTVTATDPDQTPLNLSVENLPEEATFDPITGAFQWVPNYRQAGSHTLIFKATDGEATIQESLNIVVWNSNTAPAIVEPAADAFEINEGETLVIPIVAYDREGDTLTITLGTATGWPLEGGFFMQTGPQTARMEWTPRNHQQDLLYNFWIDAQDMSSFGSKTFTVLVHDVP